MTKEEFRDLSNKLTLHFILGSSSKEEFNLSDAVYDECRKAFDANRGKYEFEVSAVQDVLQDYFPLEYQPDEEIFGENEDMNHL